MSGGKFASLTANLLVRKGDARPSTILPLAAYPAFVHRETEGASDDDSDDSAASRGVVLAMASVRVESGFVQEVREPVAKTARGRSAAPPRPPGDKPRRLMVTLTPMEHETLGLVGVKKRLTRHQLLRNAVDEYLALLVEEYDGDCRCIQAGCACDDPDNCR